MGALIRLANGRSIIVSSPIWLPWLAPHSIRWLRRVRTSWGFAGLIALGLTSSHASGPRFDVPILCDLGRDCFIQNYFDHDPTPDWRDHGCGRLSYDGHRGTDFRLKNQRQMAGGVSVVAAAAGTVTAARDGEPDISLVERTTLLRKDREAGNGVRISHGEGWETQYSHLQLGSVRVRVGQQVEAGTVLGRVGLSGKTEFPHVDFAVRKNGQPVDPFSVASGLECGETKSTLWSAKALDRLTYRPSGLLGSGFASRVLSRREIESGDGFVATLSDTAEAIVFHAEVFGIRKGDVEEIRVTDPQGRVLANRSETVQRDMALRSVHLGKRRGNTAWTSGRYAAHYVLRRGEAIAVESNGTVEVR